MQERAFVDPLSRCYNEETLLATRIMDKTGLARRQILLNWSHTHSGPMLGDSDVNTIQEGTPACRS